MLVYENNEVEKIECSQGIELISNNNDNNDKLNMKSTVLSRYALQFAHTHTE